MGRLLAARGVALGEAELFLNPTLKDLFPDPSSFADMDKAAGVILDSIVSGKKVAVFADYDVDGGTSSAILSRYFRAWGRELILYVPDRLTEGFGPTPGAFRALQGMGAELELPGFQGGGYLAHGGTEWRGVLTAQLGPVSVTGFGVLGTEQFLGGQGKSGGVTRVPNAQDKYDFWDERDRHLALPASAARLATRERNGSAGRLPDVSRRATQTSSARSREARP